MSKQLRDAAQAMLDATTPADRNIAHARLKAALAAPEPTADERVAEHMALVTDIAVVTRHHFGYADKMRKAFAAVEQSARALLGAAQEDAEPCLTNAQIDAIADSIMEPCDSGDAAADDLDKVLMRRFARAAIRAAMKETK